VNARSASGKILAACDERQLLPVLTKPLLAEYRYILGDPEIVTRYPVLEERKVKLVIVRLTYIGEMIRSVRKRFNFPRDPKDAKLIEAAIAGKADFLVTRDADLLDLPTGRDEAAKRFRQRLPMTEVLPPEVVIARFEDRTQRN
jgi:putative PIN family toxin of toxin-antitoxin system